MPKLHHNHRHHKVHAHQIPAHVTAFINAHVQKAQEISKRTLIPVSMILAQAAEESSWGRAAPDNAYFGIKGKSPTGGSTTHATHEVVNGRSVGESDSFRSYKDFEEAADDYAAFLISNKGYSAAFKHTDDPISFAKAIGRSGYATNPQYGANLVSIITVYKLTQYEVNPMKQHTQAAKGKK